MPYTVVTNDDTQTLAAEPPAGEAETVAPTRDPETVLARVHGEPITYAQAEAGFTEGMFGRTRERILDHRLERLIRGLAVDYYLRTQGMRVADKSVEEEIKRLRETPPAMGGCICCGYSSLEEYLDSKFMTLDELRQESRNNMGLERQVHALWEAEYPAGEKRQALLAAQRPRLERGFVHVAHVFVNTMPKSAYDGAPERLRKKGEKKLKEVVALFKQGKTFEEVARRLSDDTFTRKQGGDLGCIQANLFGSEVERQLLALAYDTISEPVESPWGFHLFMRKAMGEQELLLLLETEDLPRRTDALLKRILSTAKIERFSKDS